MAGKEHIGVEMISEQRQGIARDSLTTKRGGVNLLGMTENEREKIINFKGGARISGSDLNRRRSNTSSLMSVHGWKLNSLTERRKGICKRQTTNNERKLRRRLKYATTNNRATKRLTHYQLINVGVQMAWMES